MGLSALDLRTVFEGASQLLLFKWDTYLRARNGKENRQGEKDTTVFSVLLGNMFLPVDSE